MSADLRAPQAFDAVSYLTWFALMLVVLPARLVLPSLGGAGRPAVILGVGGAFLWFLGALVHARRDGLRPSLARQAVIIFFLAFTVAYALGHARGLPADEANATDRALIVMVSFGGVALLAADSIVERARLDALLQRLTVFGSVMAGVGILQFATGVDVARWVRVPGLVLNRELYGITERGGPGFNRVAGTAGHPIEFGVVSAMLLPLALHYALHAESRVERQWRWLVVTALTLAVPFSISRSGTIALAVVSLVLIPVWSPALRRRAVVISVVGAMALRAVVPGLLGTVRGLFKDLESDPSVQGRTNDYDEAFWWIAQRPWFGRGPRTFLPHKYIVLDNQYLNTAITMGYVGLAALTLLFAGAVAEARRIYKDSADPQTRHLGQALAAAFLAAALTSFTFDSLAFPTFSGCLFLMIGCTVALRRMPTGAASGRDRDVLRHRAALAGAVTQ